VVSNFTYGLELCTSTSTRPNLSADGKLKIILTVLDFAYIFVLHRVCVQGKEHIMSVHTQLGF